mgnify:CR=1 FL=1
MNIIIKNVKQDLESSLLGKEYSNYLSLERKHDRHTVESYNYLQKFIGRKQFLTSNDFEAFIVSKYFFFLCKKYPQNQVPERFLNSLTNYSEAILSKEQVIKMWDWSLDNNDFKLLHEHYVVQIFNYSKQPVFVANYAFTAHLIGDEETISKIIEKGYFETQFSRLTKLKYLVGKKLHEQAFKYIQTFSEKDLAYKALRWEYEDFMMMYHPKKAAKIIEYYKNEDNNRWAYLSYEFYIVQSKNKELQKFRPRLKKEKGRRKQIHSLWKIIALAVLGNYHKSSYLFTKKFNYYDLEKVLNNYEIHKLYYYLGKYWLKKIGLVDKSLTLLRKSIEFGYLNKDFDYKVKSLFEGFDQKVIEQFKVYYNKPYIIHKVVNAIINNKRLIEEENYQSLFEFFKNYIEYYKNTYKRSIQVREAYIKILIELKRYDEAEEICKENIKKYPNNPRVYNTYGNFAKEYLQNYERAEELYEKSIELDQSKKPYYRNNLAKLYIDYKVTEKYQSARIHLKKALKIDSNFGYAKQNLEILKDLH